MSFFDCECYILVSKIIKIILKLLCFGEKKLRNVVLKVDYYYFSGLKLNQREVYKSFSSTDEGT